MSTTTPLVGYVKMDQGENQDIDVLNANFDKADQASKGKFTLPHGIYRKTDGFGTPVPDNVETVLVGWTAVLTEYSDLSASVGGLAIAYSAGSFTIPCTGIYQLEAGIKWTQLNTAADTNGTRRLSIYQKRGAATTEIRRDARSASGLTGFNPYNHASKTSRCVAGDVIEFRAVQSSGVTISLDATQSGLFIYCSIVCMVRTD